jgi:hypothetical protein
MSEPVELRRVGVLSVFDEARDQISAWEKENPTAVNIALVLDGQPDTIVTIAGPDKKLSDSAGLLFSAAHIVLELA